MTYFPATGFQISNVHAGTGATNVVPGTLDLLFNFRFNTEQTPERLQARGRRGVRAPSRSTPTSTWIVVGSAVSHATRPAGRRRRAASIEQVTGVAPELSTGGGTSDGRFIAPTGAEVDRSRRGQRDDPRRRRMCRGRRRRDADRHLRRRAEPAPDRTDAMTLSRAGPDRHRAPL